MTKPRSILFLCTGNSCRSQMAEALVNHLLGAHWRARSAGTEPEGRVHPLALAVLAEIGVSGEGLRSKSVGELADRRFDRVVTVCDHAARNCPVWLGGGRVEHWPYPDPAKAKGSEAERLEVFRALRDRMREELPRALLMDTL